MGAQVSTQAVRRLPKKASPETLTKTPRESPSTLSTVRDTGAPASKDEEAFLDSEMEVRDPHLHENLTKLGPVKIEPTLTKMHTADAMLGILQQRRRIEEQEEAHTGPTPLLNRIPIDDLYSMMEQRKRSTPGEFDTVEKQEELSKRYAVDKPTLAILLKYYNNVAVMPPALEDKNERRLAVWVNNAVEWKASVEKIEFKNEFYARAKAAAMKDNAPSPDVVQHLRNSTPRHGVETPDQIKEKKLKDLFED
ncbi:hypothetical protein BDF14DRAFT_1874627 [Spinellus fusiger]|nr:hypothetical protein BDF14DRAFT_1874627 [Spinellus fusiger]